MSFNSGSEEDQQGTKDDHLKRPLMCKFTTTATITPAERKFSAILSTGFDKRLTIEKARFDSAHSSSTIPTASTSTLSIPSSQMVEDIKAPLASSITLPIVPPTTAVQTMPSQSTPLLTKSIKPKPERNAKRKKLPPLSGAATPSEIFHRNLVDAVSNVEDSDENEQYVYPYSTDTTGTHHPESIQRTTSSSLYRPRSSRSLHSQQSFFGKAPANFFSDLLKPILLQRTSEFRQQQQQARPKLRSYVMDHQSKLSQTSSIDSPRRYSYYADGGYTTDDEEAQYLLTPTPSHHKAHFYHPYSKSSNCMRYTKRMAVILLTLILLMVWCIFYAAKPLTQLKVDMGRVLSSDKELIFDLHVHAVNKNAWTIRVADADMSVFAFSQVLTNSNPILQGADPAEYLGGFYHFDEPLSFPSSLYTNKSVAAISQIRIKSPGADKSGNERWSRIIRFPYGLVVRGVLKYKPLSFLSLYPESVTICNVVRINPVTGTISNDLDQEFCLTS